MTNLEPEVSDNGRYSITEAAKVLGLHRNTLLLHTDQCSIRCGIRKANGRKFYTGADIKKFWKAQY